MAALGVVLIGEDRSKVGFGRSEAVSGVVDPPRLVVDERRDVCARTTEVGIRWCNV
jgi:hypothetical protein